MEKSTDQLTGLFTEVSLYPEMTALIESGEPFAVAALDIDGLLALNHDFGHQAGDAVFRLIGKCILEIFPAPNMAFRDGGDHFTILFPKMSKEDAFLKAEELRKAVHSEVLDYKPITENLTKGSAGTLTQSISIGIASFPDDGTRLADISRSAESALIRAKRTGRNKVCLAKEEKLTPKTSHYTQSQLEKLTILSKKLDVGESALMREALDGLLKKYDE
jgi:diguanylate cyclase (GGDEF)-like protein